MAPTEQSGTRTPKILTHTRTPPPPLPPSSKYHQEREGKRPCVWYTIMRRQDRDFGAHTVWAGLGEGSTSSVSRGRKEPAFQSLWKRDAGRRPSIAVGGRAGSATGSKPGREDGRQGKPRGPAGGEAGAKAPDLQVFERRVEVWVPRTRVGPGALREGRGEAGGCGWEAPRAGGKAVGLSSFLTSPAYPLVSTPHPPVGFTQPGPSLSIRSAGRGAGPQFPWEQTRVDTRRA